MVKHEIVTDWSLYPNFSESEFACSHTGKCEMKKSYMDIIQAIRTEYGKPMSVNSGFRDKTHPIEAKKSKPGEHYYGACGDYDVPVEDVYLVVNIAIKHGITRIGVSQKEGAPRFLHLGIGAADLPFPRIWSY